MATYEETSSRAAELAITKLKRDAANVAGGAELVEDEKRRAGEEKAPTGANGDDAVEDASLTGQAQDKR